MVVGRRSRDQPQHVAAPPRHDHGIHHDRWQLHASRQASTHQGGHGNTDAAPARSVRASRATMKSSIVVEPPRLFTISATRSSARMLAPRPPPGESAASTAPSKCSTVALDDMAAHRVAPGSPCMPSPSSISPAAGPAGASVAPGRLHVVKAAPIDFSPSAAAHAAAATSPRCRPAAAAAPATCKHRLRCGRMPLRRCYGAVVAAVDVSRG